MAAEILQFPQYNKAHGARGQYLIMFQAFFGDCPCQECAETNKDRFFNEEEPK